MKIIAEIGVNHDGSIDKAKSLIDGCREAGADTVKFQSYRTDSLALGNPDKVEYQQLNDQHKRSHSEMLRELELSYEDQALLKDFCDETGIEFMSTPYDVESARFLKDIGVRCYKTASADITDGQLHEYLAMTRLPVYVSTGMATLAEINDCLKYYSDGQDITLLHCTSNYPCSDFSVNMRALPAMSEVFKCPIGYSDHTTGDTAGIMSVAMGAEVIEKHVTLFRGDSGPDHKASMELQEFGEFCAKLREAHRMLGDGKKRVQEEEMSMFLNSRKSLTLVNPKRVGELIVLEDLTMARPGSGLSWRFLKEVIGKRAGIDMDRGHQVVFEDLE